MAPPDAIATNLPFPHVTLVHVAAVPGNVRAVHVIPSVLEAATVPPLAIATYVPIDPHTTDDQVAVDGRASAVNVQDCPSLDVATVCEPVHTATNKFPPKHTFQDPVPNTVDPGVHDTVSVDDAVPALVPLITATHLPAP